MGIAYPPRPLAEPRSGRYAGCKRVAVRSSAAYPMGRERMLEPRSECAEESFAFGGKPHEVRPKGSQGAARGAYRESDSFAMWAVHHGVTVSMTTVSISSFYSLETMFGVAESAVGLDD